MTDESFSQIIQQARELVAGKQFREAFRTLSLALDYPGTHIEDELQLREALLVFSDIARGLKEEDLVEKAVSLRDNLNDPAALYNYAYDLYEARLYGFAATLLSRADRIFPGAEKIVTELVINLENLGLNKEAVATLQRYGELQKNSFFCNYLLAFNSVLCGNLKQARAAYDLLKSKKESTQAEFGHLTERIELLLKRADRAGAISSLDSTDLRGWQYVVNTNILLHTSPHGRKEGMNGRYAFIQDSETYMRMGIALLKTALSGLNLQPERLLYPQEEKSETLARATAKVLKLPVEALTEENDETPGLIVVYDLSLLEASQFRLIETKRDGQLVWSHMNCWTAEDSFSPEFSTILYQFSISPWDEQLSAKPGSRELDRAVRFTGSMDETVERIVSAPFNPENDDEKSDHTALETFVTGLRKQAEKEGIAPAAIFTSETANRPRKWRGSPVQSSYFT
ncbi:MAG: hypothetical protein N2691_03895 [Patescibacteria group bacterium]|nr:hypothetical protein [Patescibacteria group bacterium]